MSDRPSKEKADRLREIANAPDDVKYLFSAREFEIAQYLREYADLLERPPEASGCPSCYGTGTHIVGQNESIEICADCDGTGGIPHEPPQRRGDRP